MAQTPSPERPELDDRVVARVPAATREALHQAALRHHRTPGGELRAAIDAWLNTPTNSEGPAENVLALGEGPVTQRTQGGDPGLSKTAGAGDGHGQVYP